MRSCLPTLLPNRGGLANDSLWRLSSVLRTSLIICRLVSRIRPNRVCVAAFLGRTSTDYPFTSSCSPRGIAGSQLLSVTGGKLRQRGTFTLPFKCAPKRTHAAPMELGESRSEEKNHTTWIDGGEEFRLI